MQIKFLNTGVFGIKEKHKTRIIVLYRMKLFLSNPWKKKLNFFHNKISAIHFYPYCHMALGVCGDACRNEHEFNVTEGDVMRTNQIT